MGGSGEGGSLNEVLLGGLLEEKMDVKRKK